VETPRLQAKEVGPYVCVVNVGRFRQPGMVFSRLQVDLNLAESSG